MACPECAFGGCSKVRVRLKLPHQSAPKRERRERREPRTLLEQGRIGPACSLWRSPFLEKSGRSPLVNAYVRTLHTLSQPRRASIAAEHAGTTILEVASVEDCVQNRDGRSASDPPRRGNSSAPQIRQLFQDADGGDLVGHHLVALNSWDASTVQPKRFLRRRPSGPTTRMRRWLCWGSSATPTGLGTRLRKAPCKC